MMDETAATKHPDYEAAFQAAEQAARKELGCGVVPEPIACPHIDGWHTWAFVPSGEEPTTQRFPVKISRVEVQLEAEDKEGRVPVHFTVGPPRDPTIVHTREVGGS